MTNRPQDSDIDFIKALAELLRANDLSEIEVSREFGEDDTLTVRVARQVAVAPAAAPAPLQIAAAATPAPAPAAAPAPSSDPAEDPGVVPSPMVGTAYLQGEPGAPPFVKVGDTVSEGQTILIIEAMKTMNQIPATRAGTITEILVTDSEPVEYGQPLVVIA
jgi:acetyl-CoA carboxylase biotin carboxyl carrier protein